MASRTASSGAQIEPGIVARVAAGLRYALTGNAPQGWFGPMSPIEPALSPKEAEAAGVAGRQFDYRTGFNVDLRPRSGEAIGFPELRALAENFDVLRLVIETRKDQLCALGWTIRPEGKGAKEDARSVDLIKFFKSPDREHDWDAWLRLLLEDLFVIDAPSVYVRRTVGGEVWGLETMDGATIKRVIDDTGRTPMEGAAYQQILKGLPAVNYTREELIYRPRNIRTHKVYGYSPVEQIVNTVNIALRRQLFTLNYFTDGTVPDALCGTPDSWTPKQIAEMQDYMDTLMQDKTRIRKLTFLPGDLVRGLVQTKSPPLKDQFDEWLARVVCYCFSIEPTPFVAQVNRAVAETSREQSRSEGLGPAMKWVKGLIDHCLRGPLQAPGYEFAWADEGIQDPLVRMQVETGYVAAKVLHPDEVRADLGRDPLTPAQKEDLKPPAPVAPGGEPGEKPQDGKAEPKAD